jgi:hypothetical protein
MGQAWVIGRGDKGSPREHIFPQSLPNLREVLQTTYMGFRQNPGGSTILSGAGSLELLRPEVLKKVGWKYCFPIGAPNIPNVSSFQNHLPSIAEGFHRRPPVACDVEQFVTFASCLMESSP